MRPNYYYRKEFDVYGVTREEIWKLIQDGKINFDQFDRWIEDFRQDAYDSGYDNGYESGRPSS
jgi:hypothetical protein